ncbi:hypothetical protein EV193_106357 [Herbihabitans rhizosphaerae]|uniref:Excreted virulence factor EspC (Type VII ESX diderm) n=1 Tax=Herbihabitans rhizosphaerae TaxID=1872711 RepID=A0A4Q7KKL2_9PSEU|nr:hypothetical protein [Herbihabitans rhizosphaerae]RZS37119.1 hypothetical protein EV193_106357 [Herbihabitans rhizosphaerae]
MTDGYNADAGELAIVADAMRQRSGSMSGWADELGATGLTVEDFGAAFADAGTAYLAAVRDRLAAGVRAYSDSNQAFGDMIGDTATGYIATDEHEAQFIREVGKA